MSDRTELTFRCFKCDLSAYGADAYELAVKGHTCPKPAVELPSVPTLGWLSDGHDEPILGHWRSYEPNFRRDDGEEYKSVLQDERDINRDRVTAFTEAVAVPKSALETLLGNVDCSGPLSCLQEHLDAFLDAIDDASTR